MSEGIEEVGIWLSKSCPPKTPQTTYNNSRRLNKTLKKKLTSCKMRMNHFGGGLKLDYLTQTSPASPQLLTARKQSMLTDFFSRQEKVLHQNESNKLKDQTDEHGQSLTSTELNLVPQVSTDFVPEVCMDLSFSNVNISPLSSPESPDKALPKQNRHSETKLELPLPTDALLDESIKLHNDICNNLFLQQTGPRDICCNTNVEKPVSKSNDNIYKCCDEINPVLEKRKILEEVILDNSFMVMNRKKLKIFHDTELKSARENVQPDYLVLKNGNNASQVLNRSIRKLNMQGTASMKLYDGSTDPFCFINPGEVAGKSHDNKKEMSTLLFTESCSLDFSLVEVGAKTSCLPPLTQDDYFKDRKEKHLLEFDNIEFTDNEIE